MSDAMLLPYQQAWIADESPVKIIEKSRRVGLSYSEASDNVLHAAAADGANVYYISFDKEMTQGYINDCAMWAKAFGAAAGEIGEEVFPDPQKPDKAIFKFTVQFASGFEIHAFSSNPRNLRSKGRPGEILVIDEAAFVDDLVELLKAALAMTMWGGQVHVISTHNGTENPFNTLIEEVRAGKFPYSLHRVTLDDALRDGLFKRICKVTGQEWSEAAEAAWREMIIKRYGDGADEELFCIPSQGGGKYLPRALIESRMSTATPVLRLAMPDSFNLLADHIREAEINEWLMEYVAPLLAPLQHKRAFFGEDFGRTGDLTVLTVATQDQGLKLGVEFMVELRNMPFKQQEQIVFFILDHLSRFLGGAFDARGNGSYLAEVALQKYGPTRIEAVMLTEQWYRDNMPPFKAAFEDGTLDAIPKDADIMDDLRAFEVVRGVARIPDKRTVESGDKKSKRHGDAGISLVMTHYASRKLNGGPINVASGGTREARTILEGYE